ncbi:hypothetical protein SAMN05660649_02001 [Desulfotomaculum arcticum]|uniref:UPF0235 protein SAMN05660649_02001 n=1 Tax=Desulfotruncus arcticus DSM 17038 TaxID=1121424 RepID=A0A1I2T137_9FIRM|nr:DUF167 domain-containing protein [Desulfotruncus arcticus]SFG56156.1 hypothetical protein SAMN05660649_02001 [Desulfotomaculum arcticum] [Desulfotruncus arcticus DSM 17038]
MLDIKDDGRGVSIRVKVQPRASKNQVAGFMEGAVKLRLTAPPVEGEANKACCEFLAGLLGIAKSRVEITQGQTGRNKTIRIEGISADAVLKKLGG